METYDGMLLPEGYGERMRRQLGGDGFAAYLRALALPPLRALRVNLLKRPNGGTDGALRAMVSGPVPWAEGAYFVREDARPGLSPLHEAGLFYLQEPSALSAVSALEPRPGERVLDLCAAPGGKSTQIAARMAGRGLLVANEIVPSRAQILSRNVERMGVRNAVVTCASPGELAARFPDFFDRVLVDAPCSGEGMFRRQSEAREQWSEAAVRGCAQRQLGILHNAAGMLRPGGTLVYSTCTFNEEENEGVLARFLDAHPEFALEPFALGGLPRAARGFLHLYPHEIPGEGHFVARLAKRADAPTAWEAPAAQETRAHARRRTRGGARAGQDARREAERAQERLLDAIAPGARFERPHLSGGCLWALPEGLEPERLSGLRALRTGLLLGREQGARMEPEHALALALAPREAARSAELTPAQALAYQAGEALALGEALCPGYTLLCLEGVPLGWGKQADGLMKNRYPKGLRRRAE